MDYSNTVVILAAGKGTRMQSDTPKVLLEVAGKPILQHVIDYWQDKAKDFVFVVGYRQELVVDFLSDYLDEFTVVTQNEQRGIAHAILQAEKMVPDKFIVALGDCIHVGSFNLPADMSQGYMCWQDEYSQSMLLGCSVKVDWKGNVIGIKEKPSTKVPGLGIYFFQKNVFDYIRSTKPSKLRGEVEITNVIDYMIRSKETFKAVWLKGEFINCTTPSELAYAEKVLRINEKTDLLIECKDALV